VPVRLRRRVARPRAAACGMGVRPLTLGWAGLPHGMATHRLGWHGLVPLVRYPMAAPPMPGAGPPAAMAIRPHARFFPKIISEIFGQIRNLAGFFTATS